MGEGDLAVLGHLHIENLHKIDKLNDNDGVYLLLGKSRVLETVLSGKVGGFGGKVDSVALDKEAIVVAYALPLQISRC